MTWAPTCNHCGYDLHGNSQTPICPECGEIPTTEADPPGWLIAVCMVIGIAPGALIGLLHLLAIA